MWPVLVLYFEESNFFRYCDVACNTTECMYDGGDCLGKDTKMGFGDSEEDHAFHFEDDDTKMCSPGCLDNWLADK